MSLILNLLTLPVMAVANADNSVATSTTVPQIIEMNDLALLFIISVILFGISMLIEFKKAKAQDKR